jgi:hypothetical protein
MIDLKLRRAGRRIVIEVYCGLKSFAGIPVLDRAELFATKIKRKELTCTCLVCVAIILYSVGQPCSNDWCGLFNSYYSISPMRSLQTITPTNPNCLNQPTSCNGTGSLVTVLPFGTQRRATTFEIYYNDLLCAYDSDNYADSTYCPLISPGVYLAPFLPYQRALANAAFLQPNSTIDVQGKTSLSGSSSIH